MTPSTAIGSPQPAPEVQPGGPDAPISSTTSVLAEYTPQRLARDAVNKYSLIAGGLLVLLVAGVLAKLVHWLYLGAPEDELLRIWR